MAAQDSLLNGRYQLITQQASGGMAVVYKAQDLALGRTVAIKVLRPSLTNDATFLARFRQEARNVANLSHPNIVTVHDFGQDGNTYYIVMEFVEGQDLKKLIRAEAPLPIERALNIAIQICAGVGYAHRAGLVHADVKPQNVLITLDDHVKVTDFGIAQALSATQPLEKQSVVWGSPHYFAPEQASGDGPTTASDVYAIGIVMFEMITGKLPYTGVDQQQLALAHMREPVPHVMDYNPRVPKELDGIIYKVMSKDPNARYRTADQLGRILISYKQQGNEPTMNQPINSPAVNTPAAPVMPIAPTIPPAASAGVAAPPIITNRPAGQFVPPAVQPQITPPPAYNPAAPTYNPPRPASTPSQQAAAAIRPTGNTGPLIPPAPQPTMQPPAPNYAPPSYMQSGYTPADVFPRSSNSQAPSNASQSPISPNYQVTPPPAPIDVVTLVLGVIAFLAIVGLIPLWLAVLTRGS